MREMLQEEKRQLNIQIAYLNEEIDRYKLDIEELKRTHLDFKKKYDEIVQEL